MEGKVRIAYLRFGNIKSFAELLKLPEQETTSILPPLHCSIYQLFFVVRVYSSILVIVRSIDVIACKEGTYHETYYFNNDERSEQYLFQPNASCTTMVDIYSKFDFLNSISLCPLDNRVNTF